MGYKTKSMLHLAIVNPVDAKEKKKEKEEGGTGANYGGRTLWDPPRVKSSITPTSGSQSSKWGELGSLAVGLVSKFSEDGVGRSTGNFDKKIAKKEKRGKKAGAARAERREAKWDYRQNKKAKKISAKTEGTYQPEKKESKDEREDFKRTGTASELKENQLRRANAAKEETKPAGDTGSDIVGITNTGTSGFNSSNYTDFGKNYVPEKPVFNNKNRFKKIEPNVNTKNPGKGGETPTKVLTKEAGYSPSAVEGFIRAAADAAKRNKSEKMTKEEIKAVGRNWNDARDKAKAITDAKRNVIPMGNK